MQPAGPGPVPLSETLDNRQKWLLLGSLMVCLFVGALDQTVVSTATPKILADLKSMKENVREQALAAFHHKASGVRPAEAPDAALARVSGLLVAAGWKAKAEVRPHGTMVAARKGAANKIGYLAAHSAIVLVYLGGLLDGDLVVRAQMELLGKSVYSGGGLISERRACRAMASKIAASISAATMNSCGPALPRSLNSQTISRLTRLPSGGSISAVLM